MNDLISIIVPVYNSYQYLDTCITSIIKQTYKKIEVILIDDGSTDLSPQICLKYKNADPRIRFFRQTHAGVSVARNRGLMEATGNWITFVDADDWLESTYLEKLLLEATAQIDMVCVRDILSDKFSKKRIIEDSVDMVAYFSNQGYTWGKLIRHTCIRTFFLEGIQFAEDYIFYISIIPFLKRICVVENLGYHYKKKADGLSSKVLDTTDHKIMQSKLTFLLAEKELKYVISKLNFKCRIIAREHCCYIYTILLIDLQKMKEKDKFHLHILKQKSWQYIPYALYVNVIQRRKIRRFLFEFITCISPIIANCILESLIKYKGVEVSLYGK